VPDDDDNDDDDNVTHENIIADGVMRNVQIAGVGSSSTSLTHQESRPTALFVTSKNTTCTSTVRQLFLQPIS
jgi:hypothetical protein